MAVWALKTAVLRNDEILFVHFSQFFRVLKHLGCPHGCADGQRGPAAEFLRTQCQNILTRLDKSSQKQFKKFLRDYVKVQPITEMMDILHAYLGYCVDPTSLLSPLSKINYSNHVAAISKRAQLT